MPINFLKLLKRSSIEINEAFSDSRLKFLDDMREEFGSIMNIDKLQYENMEKLHVAKEMRLTNLIVFDQEFPSVRELHNRVN